jgi:hypothetical protein
MADPPPNEPELSEAASWEVPACPVLNPANDDRSNFHPDDPVLRHWSEFQEVRRLGATAAEGALTGPKVDRLIELSGLTECSHIQVYALSALWLADLPAWHGKVAGAMSKRLLDGNRNVRMYAAMGLVKLKAREYLPKLEELMARVEQEDHTRIRKYIEFLRQC